MRIHRFALTGALLALSFLSACATAASRRDLPPGGKGTRERVAPELRETQGLASWYGKRFHGRKTASGERYDMNALTAAHRTLPFGTRVRVKHAESGKSVVVRINDRGPYSGRRVIDLSRAAGEAIGILGAGVARVELELVQ